MQMESVGARLAKLEEAVTAFERWQDSNPPDEHATNKRPKPAETRRKRRRAPTPTECG
jgi:hypothetical protein